MKKSSIFKKKNISFLYVYLLSSDSEKTKSLFIASNKIDPWFDDFKDKRKSLEKKIELRFKEGWNLERIPLIEKTILLISSYEIVYMKKDDKDIFSLISKVVDFSKKYLDNDKFKYINGVLDSVAKEKN